MKKLSSSEFYNANFVIKSHTNCDRRQWNVFAINDITYAKKPQQFQLNLVFHKTILYKKLTFEMLTLHHKNEVGSNIHTKIVAKKTCYFGDLFDTKGENLNIVLKHP